MRNLSLILFLLLVGTLSAQRLQRKTDSLLALIPNQPDSLKCNSYSKLCMLYWYNNPEKSFRYGWYACKIGETANNVKFLSTAYTNLGVTHDVKSQYDSAMYYYRKAVIVSDEAGFAPGKAGALNNIGLLFWNNGVLDSAAYYYAESAIIFEKVNNYPGLGNTYNNMGLIYEEQRLTQEARKFYKKALYYKEITHDDAGLGATYDNIGATFLATQLDSALFYCKKGLDISLRVNDEYGIATASYNIASALKLKQQYAEALTYINQSISYRQHLDNEERLILDWAEKADILRGLKQYADATQALNEADKINARLNLVNNKVKVMTVRVALLRDQGRYEEAFKIWDKLSFLKDSIQEATNKDNLIKYQTRFDSERKERQIATQNFTIAQQKTYNQLLLAIAVSVVIVLFGAFWYINNRNKQRELAERRTREREYEESLLKAVVKSEENERQRIAKDLHDGVGVQLSGLKYTLQRLAADLTAESKELPPSLELMTKALDDTAADVRSLSHQLMPRALQELGLIPALEDLFRKSFHAVELPYTFEHIGTEERFSENIEIGIYRIAQELANNIIKHAQATHVEIQLFKNKNTLILLIEDNGRGFDPSQNKDGIGLNNIESRVRTIHGELKFETVLAQGTIAIVRVPL